MAVTWKKLAYEDDVMAKVLLTGKGDIIYASSIGVPAVLPIGTNDYILRVATDIPAWEAIGAPAAHTLDAHTAAAAAVDFNLQQATDLVFKTVANVSALPVADIAVGEPCFATADLSLHICTAIV